MRDYCCHLSPPLEPGLLTASPSEHKSCQASALPSHSISLTGWAWGLPTSPPLEGGGGCPPSSPANLGQLNQLLSPSSWMTGQGL